MLQKRQFMCQTSSVCYLLKCNVPAQPCSTHSGVSTYIAIKHLLRTVWVCRDGTCSPVGYDACLHLYWYRTILDWNSVISSTAPPSIHLSRGLISQANWKHLHRCSRPWNGKEEQIFLFFSHRNLVDLFGHSIFHVTGIHWHFELYLCLHQTVVTYRGGRLQFHFNGLLENRQLSVLLRGAATANKQLPDFLCQNVTGSWWRKISW